MHLSAPEPVLCAVGVGLRAPHYRELLDERPSVDWLEVHTENYLHRGGWDRQVLFSLRRDYPISLHGVGLGLGSAHGFSRTHLQRVRDLVHELEPCLVSEHLCWSSMADRCLNDLLPLPFGAESLALLCQRVEQFQECLGRTILLENVSTYLRYQGDAMSEIEFLVVVAQRTGCRILLDVNNLYVNQCNHRESALEALTRVPVGWVGEIHLAGHLVLPDAVVDHHGAKVADSVWELYRAALQRFGALPTLIEWDTDLPPLHVLIDEADTARACAKQVQRNAAESVGPSQTRDSLDVQIDTPTGDFSTLPDASPVLTQTTSLSQLQTVFATALFHDDTPDHFQGGALHAEERFARYRGNLHATWHKTLASTFPVVQALVGEDFFAGLSHEFGHAYPSVSGDLAQFGSRFATFLSEFPHVAQLPYLPDMARLEWAIHCAYYAEDADGLTAPQISVLSPRDLQRTCFRLHPSCSLLQSNWAIVEIWQAHQKRDDAPFPKDWEVPCTSLVCRPTWNLRVVAISNGAHALLSALKNQQPFAAALDAALACEPNFDLAPTLQRCVELCLLLPP